MISKRFVFLTAIVFLLVMPIMLFGQEVVENEDYEGEKVIIKYSTYGGANTVDYLRRIALRFVEEHPSIAVEIGVYPWGQYWTKIQTQASSGLAPDVLTFYGQVLPIWIVRGALLPLDDLIAESDLNLDDYYKIALENCTWEGKLYAFPLELPVLAMIYNVDRFEESGIPEDEWPQADKALTWEEFRNLVDRLTLHNPDGTFSQHGMAGADGFSREMFKMYGGSFVDRQVSPTRANIVGDEALRRAMIEIYNMQYGHRVYAPASALSTAGHTAESLLQSDKFAMTQVGIWTPRTLHEAGVNFRFSPSPRNTHPTNSVGCNALAIFKDSKHPEEAWKFVQFMAGEEVQRMIGSALRGLPTLKVASDSVVNNNFGIEGMEAFYYGVPDAQPDIITDNNFLLDAYFEGIWRIDARLANAYDKRFYDIPRDSNGNISKEDYQAFVTGMEALVVETVDELLPQMEEEMNEAIDHLKPRTLTYFVRVLFPIILLVSAIIIVAVYLIVVVRKQASTKVHLGRQTNLGGYLAISPWLIGFLVFTLGPMITSFYLSLTEWNMIKPPVWVGAKHYVQLLGDKYFLIGLNRTFFYALYVIPIGLLGGLFTAGLLTADIRGREVFKAIFYFPSMFAGAAAAVLWVNMFNKEFGIVNRMLGIGGINPINWLDEFHAFYTVILMNVFWIGGAMIIYYAGMKQIPRTLYEAADIDGAGFARKFIHITIPMLSPVILFMVIISTIGAFQVFTPALFFAYSSEGIGAPGDSLRFYSVNIYDEAFNNLRMGKASCWAIVLFAIIFVVTMIQLKISKRFVHTGTE